MSRVGVTYDEVAAVCDSMLAQGSYPTLGEVRKCLGRGSFGTIAKHMQTWCLRRSLKEDGNA